MLLLWGQGGGRNVLNRVLSDGSTVADYQAGVGITGTTNASAWANQIGAAGSLLQATGANQPTINADGSLTFDGIAHFMAIASLAIAQPAYYYLVINQITWTANDTFIDGVDAGNRMTLYQHTATPKIDLYAGSAASIDDADLPVNTKSVVSLVFNGAASSIKVNGAAATTGNPSTQGILGLTVGCAYSQVTGFANMEISELIIRTSPANSANIQSLLHAIYGTP